MKIYVALPDEAVPCWAPVEAEPLGGDIYQIIENNADPEDTRWAFNTGAKVRCKWVTTESQGERILVAYEEIPNSELSEMVRRGIVRPALVPFTQTPPRRPVAPTEEILNELDADREDR